MSPGTEAEFDALYTGERKETYGPDLEEVRAANPRTVWTVVDADEADMLVVIPGLRYVGRVHYFISKQEWQDEDQHYIWWEPEEEE